MRGGTLVSLSDLVGRHCHRLGPWRSLEIKGCQRDGSAAKPPLLWRPRGAAVGTLAPHVGPRVRRSPSDDTNSRAVARRPVDADRTIIDEVSHQRRRFDVHSAPCDHRVDQQSRLLVESDCSSRSPACLAESVDPGPGHHGLGSPGGSACPLSGPPGLVLPAAWPQH